MPATETPEDAFISLYQKYGATESAKRLGVTERGVQRRRKRIEERTGMKLLGPDSRRSDIPQAEYKARIRIRVDDGFVLIGSDFHYWPKLISTAHLGFVAFCKTLKPKAVILNGDVMDFPSISRHPSIMWEDRPRVVDEIETAKERLAEIEKAAPGGAKLIWNLGNHDARFESRLATVAPEYLRVNGVHLKDNFPRWEPAWSTWINGETVVKHRFKGGIHATHNNTLWSGKTIVSGHLHSQKVTPFSDYNGTRWGVDTGCVADPYGPQFSAYTEDNPVNWRSGFGVLTYVKGELLQPELARVVRPGIIDFRGKLIDV